MYTEIYFDSDDQEILDWIATGETPSDWNSQPVRINASDESGDYCYTVLVKDVQYNDRKDKGKLDKTFKKLNKKFKRKKDKETDPDVPLHVFGPMGHTHHAPEQRDEE